jgi:hypothetical protein
MHVNGGAHDQQQTGILTVMLQIVAHPTQAHKCSIPHLYCILQRCHAAGFLYPNNFQPLLVQQERYEDLTYMDAIYWSVVTVTTIGYGDFSPSVVASQITLLGMLVLSFTILPYQTSMLLSAMTATSVYQRCSYSQGARGRHVVITGHFDHLSARLIVEQLYHADYGKKCEQLSFAHMSSLWLLVGSLNNAKNVALVLQ